MTGIMNDPKVTRLKIVTAEKVAPCDDAAANAMDVMRSALAEVQDLINKGDAPSHLMVLIGHNTRDEIERCATSWFSTPMNQFERVGMLDQFKHDVQTAADEHEVSRST